MGNALKPGRTLALILLLPLSGCDDSGSFQANDRSGAPRGTFSHAGSQTGNSAPERGELERLRQDNQSQRPVQASSGGASAVSSSSSNAVAADRDAQNDTLTGHPIAP